MMTMIIKITDMKTWMKIIWKMKKDEEEIFDEENDREV